MKKCQGRWLAAWIGVIAVLGTACADGTAGPGLSGAGGEAEGTSTSNADASNASSASTGIPTGTGSLQLSWLVDRGENCPLDSVVVVELSGPTSVSDEIPCESYGYAVTDLVAGTYSMMISLDNGSSTVVNQLNPFPIGNAPLVFADPFDLGECSLGGCGTQSVGCVDDGQCTPDDDCVCADCDTDEYCNTGFPRNCDDGLCEPYYEGCSCPDCMQQPACAG